jgi:phosphotransferase system HPr-like phosphotransfer protein
MSQFIIVLSVRLHMRNSANLINYARAQGITPKLTNVTSGKTAHCDDVLELLYLELAAGDPVMIENFNGSVSDFNRLLTL